MVIQLPTSSPRASSTGRAFAHLLLPFPRPLRLGLQASTCPRPASPAASSPPGRVLLTTSAITTCAPPAAWTCSHQLPLRLPARRKYYRALHPIYPPIDIDHYNPAPFDAQPSTRTTSSPPAASSHTSASTSSSGLQPHARPSAHRRRRRSRTAPPPGPGGPNVRLVGRVSGERLKGYLRRARAFVFAAEEDFGIAPSRPRPAAPR